MMMRPFFLLIVLLGTGVQLFAQARQFITGEEKRRYLIYLPSGYQNQPHRQFPVVFNFHGGGMTMTEQMFYSGMNKAAERYGFIAVYPQGIKQDWNVGFETSYQYGTDDVGFIGSLLSFIKTNYRVKATAVYATGLSRGGFFCYRLAAELPDKFAAIATVGALLPDSVAAFHKKSIRIPVMIIHGTEDQIVQYNGKPGAYLSAPDTYQYWKKHNGLSDVKETTSTINQNIKDSTVITITSVLEKGMGVSLVTITGGGHTLPGADPFNIGFPLGRTTTEINYNELVWKFFKRFEIVQ